MSNTAVPFGHADDPASRAAVGRMYLHYFYFRQDSLRAAEDRPVLIADDGPPGKFGRFSPTLARQVVQGGAVLHITLAPDVFRTEEHQGDVIQMLLALSKRDGFEVHVPAQVDLASDWRNIWQYSIGAPTNGYIPVTESIEGDNPRVRTTAAFESTVRLLHSKLAGANGTSDFETIVLNESRLKRGLLVTSDANLLARRSRPGTAFARSGIVDPREAVIVAYAVQRGRGIFALDTPAGNNSVDETIFYGELSNTHLGNTLKAYRSSLSPPKRADQNLTDYLESILRKYEALLVSTDDCGRLFLAEGRFDGDNGLLGRYLSVVQNAVVLFAGIFDLLARVVAHRSGRPITKPMQVSWANLIASKRPLYERLEGEAAQLAIKAQACPLDQINFILTVRQYYQHQGHLPGCVASFLDAAGHERYAVYCLLLLSKVAQERNVAVPVEFQGTFGDGNIAPFLFTKKLAQLAAECCDNILAELDTADHAWWTGAWKEGGSGLRVSDMAEQWARQWWW